jgi:phage terminase large subunit
LQTNYSDKRALPSWLLQAKIERAKELGKLRKLEQSTPRFNFRGNNERVQTLNDPEIVLVGSAGTGKTLSILYKLHRLMLEYPNSRALIVRKVRADLAFSTLVTFERDVLGEDSPICQGVQRENRRVYRYPNGSEVVVGGMDRAGAILSAEYDFIYPAEATQFDPQDWETFIMRNRNGRIPTQQIVADTNPDRPDHWLKQRCDSGKALLLNTYHTDNPRYWDNNEWTQAGRDYVLGKLDRLTGVWRERYLNGRWSLTEGAIYADWREDVHLVDKMPNESHIVKRYRVIDFGYSNPFVCLWIAEDSDGALWVYRELYQTQRLVEDWAKDITRLSANESYVATIADHDAEDRATLARHGIPTLKADKNVSAGIQAVQSRLKVQGNGKPRLYVVRGCRVTLDNTLKEAGKPTCLQEEFGGYVWSNKSTKEQPVKENDHALDALRYAIMYIDAQMHHITIDSIPSFFEF